VTRLTEEQARAYWRRNLALMVKLLAIWFVVSFGCGIILVDWLNQFHLGGYPLGFWFAQQGAIYVFVALIFYYARAMNRLDREFGVHEDPESD
jgi:putative solute:sodium symporter small subunit